jgi:uncharacterized membrane protein
MVLHRHLAVAAMNYRKRSCHLFLGVLCVLVIINFKKDSTFTFRKVCGATTCPVPKAMDDFIVNNEM